MAGPPDDAADPGAPAAPTGVRWRDRARPWLVAAGVVGLLVGLIAVAGGFRSAGADLGRTLPAGQEVALGGWRVTVLSAEYTDQSLWQTDTDPRVRVTLRLAWTGEETRVEPTSGVIALADDGVVRSEAGLRQPTSRSGGYDPGVPQTAYLEWPTPHRPAQVEVLLRSEVTGQSYLFDHSWGPGRVIGHVSLPCPDRRHR